MRAIPLRRLLAVLLVAFVGGVAAAEVTTTPPDAAGQKAVEDKIAEGDQAMKDALDALEASDKADAEAADAAAKGDKDAADKAKKAQEKLKALRDAVAKLKKLRNEAIVLADEKYKISKPKNAKGEPTYDLSTRGEGATTPGGAVKIGEAAFHDPKSGKPSAGWLASTKAHEFVHVEQLGNGTWTPTEPKGMPKDWRKQETEINEVEAYDWEIANAKANGLSDAAIAELKARRKEHYDALSDENKKKVDGKKYDTTCAAGPDKPPAVVPEPPRKKEATPTNVPEGVVLRFFGSGSPTSIRLWVENHGTEGVALDVPTGQVFRSETATIQTLVAALNPPILCPPGVSGHATVNAFCLDRSKTVPPPGEPLAPVEFVPLGLSSAEAVPLGVRDAARTALSTAQILLERHLFLPTGSVSADGTSMPGPGRPEGGTFSSTFPVLPQFVFRSVTPVSPPGPYERTHPNRSFPNVPSSAQDFEKNVEAVSGGLGLLGPAVEVAQGTADAPPKRAPDSLDQSVIIWATWATTNDGGKPDPAVLQSKTEEHIAGMGVPKDKAAAAARAIVREVIPLVTQGLERAKENAEADVDWEALDLSLAGKAQAGG